MSHSPVQKNAPPLREVSIDSNSDNEYTVPDATSVTGFVDSLKNKSETTSESGVYDEVDELDSKPHAEEAAGQFLSCFVFVLFCFVLVLFYI